MGAAPYGWRRTEERDAEGRLVLVPVPAEQKVIRRVLRERRQGRSLRDVAAKLTADQVPTKRGAARWSVASVQGILRRAQRAPE